MWKIGARSLALSYTLLKLLDVLFREILILDNEGFASMRLLHVTECANM